MEALEEAIQDQGILIGMPALVVHGPARCSQVTPVATTLVAILSMCESGWKVYYVFQVK
jgi:hypothetical protein